MLDKTQEADVTLDVPAISVQLAVTIGGTRSLTLTTGLPTDCTPRALNGLLDKLAEAADRQKKKHDLEQTRMLLKNEEQNLYQHRQQAHAQAIKFQTEFEAKGYKGDYEPKGGQKNVLAGLEQNVQSSVERIKQLRDAIEKMEKECL
jgi:hypothetical protein